MGDLTAQARASILDRLDAMTLFSTSRANEFTLVVKPTEIVDALKFLKSDRSTQFDMLTDLTAVDYWTKNGVRPFDPKLQPYLLEVNARFEVVYHLYSTRLAHRIRVKAPLPEADPKISSVIGLWPVADWLEREVFDMYGIDFKGREKMRRILLYEGFEGHPLRKDYDKKARQPLIGPEN